MDHLITKEQYDEARKIAKDCEDLMSRYHKQEARIADMRFARFQEGKEPYADDELLYAAYSLCPCGHGLAYPKKCGHEARFWDCSAIWKGIASSEVEHTGKLPFAFYDVKSEDQIHPKCEKNDQGENKTYAEMGVTTRGMFKPKPKE